MTKDLDSLKAEMMDYLNQKGMAVFQGFFSDLTEHPLALWDAEEAEDFRAYVECAAKVGVKMMILNHRRFERAMIEDGLERLETAELAREEKRTIERRMKELREYDGFTCMLELTFEFDKRLYLFDIRTEWYAEMLDLLSKIDDSTPEYEDEDEDEEEGDRGGYFSRN